MTLSQWMDRALVLYSRRASAAKYEACDRHWTGLTIQIIRAADKIEIERFIVGFLEVWNWGGGVAWARPHRGHRRGTRWETMNVEARNRLIQIVRAEDNIPMGDNRRAFA